ncbi:MAG: FRG domain-containing protein, partial [Planctomycetota bacterium]
MRGQAENYPGMVPGLFRPPTNAIDHKLLAKGEAQFEKAIRKQVRLGRFQRPHLAALLQHYGYRTTWLDVVDNLWTAVWFATHSMEPPGKRVRHATPRPKGSGWLYFLAADGQNTGCTAIDLRETHHGLSLRPHAQSGWSIRASGIALTDLNNSVVGCVEFPLGDRWAFGGHLGSSEFLFPPEGLDDTLKRLIEKRGDEIAANVETHLALPKGALGRLYMVQDKA